MISSNIAIQSNIWVAPLENEKDEIPFFLQDKIPGDLLVAILNSRDRRKLQEELTPKQWKEYEQSRFFQQHGQEGLAFE